MDTLRGDVQDRAFLGDLLPSQTTLNAVFESLAVDSEAGTFLGRNVQAFVELLARESQGAAEEAAAAAEAALDPLLQGKLPQGEHVELWECAAAAAKASGEARRAAEVASSAATAEQMRLQLQAILHPLQPLTAPEPQSPHSFLLPLTVEAVTHRARIYTGRSCPCPSITLPPSPSPPSPTLPHSRRPFPRHPWCDRRRATPSRSSPARCR